MQYQTLVMRNGRLERAIALVDTNSALNSKGGLKTKRTTYSTSSITVIHTNETAIPLGVTNVTTGEYSGYAIRRIKA